MEDVFTSCTPDKGLISWVYKELQKLHSKEMQFPINQWANSSDVLQEKKRRWPITVFLNSRNTNENYFVVLPHASQTGCHKAIWHQMLRGCGEWVTLICYWGENKLIQPLWKKVWRLLKKLKTGLHHDQDIHPWAYTQRTPCLTKKTYVHPYLLLICLL